MFILIVFAGLALWGIIAGIVELRRDGYRAVPTDWARVPGRDSSPLQEAEQSVGYR